MGGVLSLPAARAKNFSTFFKKPIDISVVLCYTVITMREAKASPTE
jgi:hypothetical protein